MSHHHFCFKFIIFFFIVNDVVFFKGYSIKLTPVKSRGIVKTIRNENDQATTTETDTKGCCLGMLPYLQRKPILSAKAKNMAIMSKYIFFLI